MGKNETTVSQYFSYLEASRKPIVQLGGKVGVMFSLDCYAHHTN